LLTLLFAVVLAQAYLRGIELSCGCFGKFDRLAGRPGLASGRARLFSLGAAYLYRRGLQRMREARIEPCEVGGCATRGGHLHPAPQIYGRCRQTQSR
jgi:hypothetical protein